MSILKPTWELGFLRRRSAKTHLGIGLPTSSECQNPLGNWASYAVGVPKPTWELGLQRRRNAKTHLGIDSPHPSEAPISTWELDLGGLEAREGKGTTIHRDFVPVPSDFF